MGESSYTHPVQGKGILVHSEVGGIFRGLEKQTSSSSGGGVSWEAGGSGPHGQARVGGRLLPMAVLPETGFSSGNKHVVRHCCKQTSAEQQPRRSRGVSSLLPCAPSSNKVPASNQRGWKPCSQGQGRGAGRSHAPGRLWPAPSLRTKHSWTVFPAGLPAVSPFTADPDAVSPSRAKGAIYVSAPISSDPSPS